MTSYIWQRPFRMRIIAACLHYPDWYYHTGISVVKPEYFDTQEESELIKFLAQYCAQYHRIPALDEIDAKFTPNDGLMDDLLYEVTNLLNDDELAYARDRAIEFAQYQAKTIALIRGGELRDKGQPLDEAFRMWEEAERIGADISDRGLDLIADVDKWIYPDHINDSDRISTGLPAMDTAMGGGISKGEYHIVVGPPGSGKTRALVNFGAGAAGHMSKANVVHITLEISAKNVARRYGSRLTGEVLQRGDELIFKQHLTSIATTKLRGCVRIKQYPNKRLTHAELNRYLDSLEAEGFETDLLIIDYSTNMKHNERLEYRHQLGTTSEELRGIAVERHIGIWDAAQAHRSAFKKEVVDLDDIAECWDQTATADGVFTVCQTKTEKAEDLLRLYNAKLREDKSNWMIRCKVMPELNLLECMEYITLAEYFQLQEDKNGKQLQITK